MVEGGVWEGGKLGWFDWGVCVMSCFVSCLGGGRQLWGFW